ncbi:hypothetical protein BOX15_Mlig018928g1 [Macrostomum lignano]|uniref:Uncharacterized protein n=2 Tax=Macrostomum lignano TaxID=282301 RepID=A0A267E3Y5_9PLAT|nr:hypothetical protein BOX15_Mlig018928g3 [Macrostomum lignano]PAA52333.1 hypothetical protein BOX15_Mlig018928g2 [Macrostomum lignano]PAA56136.1 hypothetical protein BOX15_Mlig018928g1 [Macrostomum lignano]
MEKFNLECLERVNEIRRMFCAPPLKLRLSLIIRPEHVASSYSGAQDWADNLAALDAMQSDLEATKFGIGECICRLFSEKFISFSGSAVIDTWFDEALEFKGSQWAEKSCRPVNFLQLVWPQTRYCGFGFSVSNASSAVYTVGRFKPMLPIKNEVLVAQFNQHVQKVEAHHSMTIKTLLSDKIPPDVSYVKRNLNCNIPVGPSGRQDHLQALNVHYRLSHLIRQTRVSNKVESHRVGLVYVNDQSEKLNDVIIVMQKDEE